MAIAFLQPKITHYRREFYQKLCKQLHVDIFTFADNELKKFNFQDGAIEHYPVWGIKIGPIPFYFPWRMFSRKYQVWVIGGYWFHPATWCLLILGRLLGRRVVVWGHGISVKRYQAEYRRPPMRMKMIYRLACGAMFYTEKELSLWRKILPDKPMVALGNTVGNVDDILKPIPSDRETLKKKHKIVTPVNFIFCARFNIRLRRSDLLLEAIRILPPETYGFIIIGNGKYKPDLDGFGNVYDFGQLYDDSIKRELFSIADCYFQPAWLGLSVVEAMAYGLPICTLRRQNGIAQCVEYFYVEASGCGILLNDIGEMPARMAGMTHDDFKTMGQLGRSYVAENLSIDQMVARAADLLGKLSPSAVFQRDPLV